MILQTHNMNSQNMTPEQMQSLFNIIQALQAEVTELRASHTLTLSLSQENSISIIIIKSEKLFDSLMFDNNWKKLCLFIIKLHFKLQENTNKYFTE